MIARGAAALFAHLVHYRQFRFLWAISPTRQMWNVLAAMKSAGALPSPEQILGAEALSILLLVLLIGAGTETCRALSAFGIPRGCLKHLNQRGWGWADRPKALVPGSALPSTSQTRMHRSPRSALDAPQMHQLLQLHHSPPLQEWVSADQFWAIIKPIYRIFVSCQPYQDLRHDSRFVCIHDCSLQKSLGKLCYV